MQPESMEMNDAISLQDLLCGHGRQQPDSMPTLAYFSYRLTRLAGADRSGTVRSTFEDGFC
jgi:hypothetical protein